MGELRESAGQAGTSGHMMFDPRRKAPLLAAFLSLIPGMGQIYVGYYRRGFVTAAVLLVCMFIGSSMHGDLAPVFTLSAVFVWVFNVIDAGRMAAMYNLAITGNYAMTMPDDLKFPRLGGSIVGGVLLLLFGGIALSNTAFGYPLDWLEDWWPVFPVALGAYLLLRGVVDAVGERKSLDSSGGLQVNDSAPTG